MPGYKVSESLFYSWNIGPVHFISVNTEAYYFMGYGVKPLSNQYQWLIDDLKVSENKFKIKERLMMILSTIKESLYGEGMYKVKEN